MRRWKGRLPCRCRRIHRQSRWKTARRRCWQRRWQCPWKSIQGTKRRGSTSSKKQNQVQSNSTIAINQTSEKAISVLCGRSKKFRFVFESGEGSQKWNVQCISTFNLVSRVSNFLSHWKNLEQIGALDGIPRPSSQHHRKRTWKDWLYNLLTLSANAISIGSENEWKRSETADIVRARGRILASRVPQQKIESKVFRGHFRLQ